jgi:hypothetical protein
MPISKINSVLWSSLSKVNGIAKASIAKISGVSAGPPIQTATLSATKYGLYTALSTTSWAIAINAISSVNNSTTSLAIGSEVAVTRTGTNYINTRVNLQFDLSSFSTSSILGASLTLDVSGITTTAIPNEVYVLDLGNTFDFPTLNNTNYSLVYQQGSLTEYATDTIDNTGLYELQFNATALATASTYPAAYSMALITYQDRQDEPPGSNEQYVLYFNGIPELEITYQ